MKKLALALAATTVAAGAASANIGTGFYAGLAAGYGSTTGSLTATSAAGVAPVGSVKVGAGAPNIGLHGGYGWVTGCLYFGGEVAYTFENTKITDTSSATSGQMQLKRNGYFSGAFRAGYLLTPNTMLYVRLGGNWGKWTLNDDANAGPFSAANPGAGSKNRLSFAPGLGMETAVHKNVFLRVEYTYEFGPNVRAVNNNLPNRFDNVGTLRSQSGKIGLSYKF